MAGKVNHKGMRCGAMTKFSMWLQDRMLTVLQYEYRDTTPISDVLAPENWVPSLRSTSRDSIEEEKEFVPL